MVNYPFIFAFMRKWISISIDDRDEQFERKLYRMVRAFKYAVILVDKYPFYNDNPHHYKAFDLLAGFDAIDVVNDSVAHLDRVVNSFSDWYLGYFSFDFKNDLEPLLTTSHPDKIGFRRFSFFRPRFLVKRVGGNWYVGYNTHWDSRKSCDDFIRHIAQMVVNPGELPAVDFKFNMSKNQYLHSVEKLKSHIRRGDIYEVNFCMELFTKVAGLDTAFLFDKLLKVAPMPFSTLVRDNDAFLIGASPERYLRKKGAKIISQPMKGTAGRSNDRETDLDLMRSLSESEKERAENIMITDLVRNDLSRSAARGTVKVDELCHVLPFPGVYQMISTVSCQLHPDAHWLDPLKNSFPMGSMTGAPKIKALHLIDKYEKSARGLYSGTVGYITPELDFDFNVVIRSFLYNQLNGYLSFPVGSAITDACNAHDEYQECLLKAGAINNIFS
ncbi:para-aminobenzoate synthetase component 1 [Thermophagus xiamenensis]|uniref:Para-aminobenzoate synthetase component 1 n=2 Tax=Thermophagus xiamenensis TaxID=385682 RepID=A0A1I2FJ95_9BACT|nr:para-aminobenzoate synthetase component 1 [Thermophagus xiamenensis]